MKGTVISSVLLIVVALLAGCGAKAPDSGEASQELGAHAVSTSQEGDHAHQETPAIQEMGEHDSGESSESGHEMEGHAHSMETTGTLPEGANQMCPVMPDQKVDPAIFVEHMGKRIYLCCEKCRNRVLEDPAAWYAKVYGVEEHH